MFKIRTCAHAVRVDLCVRLVLDLREGRPGVLPPYAKVALCQPACDERALGLFVRELVAINEKVEEDRRDGVVRAPCLAVDKMSHVVLVLFCGVRRRIARDLLGCDLAEL